MSPVNFTLKLAGLHMYEAAKMFPSKYMKCSENVVTLVEGTNESQCEQ